MISMLYTNYRLETNERQIIPVRLFHGETKWHGPDPKWTLEAWDTEKKDMRQFNLQDCNFWIDHISKFYRGELI